eukprot:scaffold125292_cov26-Tisochrysis_lutea.AAC.2
MRANAELRVKNKQLLAQLEEIKAQLAKVTHDAQRASEAHAGAEQARREAEERFAEMDHVHRKLLEDNERLKSDLINKVLNNEAFEPGDLELAPEPTVMETYADGTGAVHLHTPLRGISPACNISALDSWPQTSKDGMGFDSFHTPPRGLSLPGSSRTGTAKTRSSFVEVEMNHKDGGGCCVVQ